MTPSCEGREIHRALARVALRCDYPGPRGDRAPRWIVDLATEDGIPGFHMPDRVSDHLRHARQITWSALGWKLTEDGWRTLQQAAAP